MSCCGGSSDADIYAQGARWVGRALGKGDLAMKSLPPCQPKTPTRPLIARPPPRTTGTDGAYAPPRPQKPDTPEDRAARLAAAEAVSTRVQCQQCSPREEIPQHSSRSNANKLSPSHTCTGPIATSQVRAQRRWASDPEVGQGGAGRAAGGAAACGEGHRRRLAVMRTRDGHLPCSDVKGEHSLCTLPPCFYLGQALL